MEIGKSAGMLIIPPMGLIGFIILLAMLVLVGVGLFACAVAAEWKIPLFGGICGAFLALMLDFILRRTHAWVEARAKQLTLPS